MKKYIPIVPVSRLTEIMRGFIASRSDEQTRPDMNNEHNLLALCNLVVDEAQARLPLWKLECGEPVQQPDPWREHGDAIPSCMAAAIDEAVLQSAVKDCTTCGAAGCDYKDVSRCGERHYLWEPRPLHQDTESLVQRFSAAMRNKLARAELKYGYSNLWMSNDWMDECRAKLVEHLHKGDPLDVANYCAFLWHHGAHCKPVQQSEPVCNFEQELMNLLCRIHRDGGHYIAEHGVRKAIDDADLRCAENNAMLDALLEPVQGKPEPNVGEMVNRFLGWKLPKDFQPDAGITFKAEYNEGTQWPGRHEPIGTNLLNAEQAKAMFEFCLSSAPVQQSEPVKGKPEPVAFLIEGFDGKGQRVASIIQQNADNAKNAASVFAEHYPMVKTSSLYTAPPTEAAIRADEREKCAKVCDEMQDEDTSGFCASAIRAMEVKP